MVDSTGGVKLKCVEWGYNHEYMQKSISHLKSAKYFVKWVGGCMNCVGMSEKAKCECLLTSSEVGAAHPSTRLKISNL